MKKPKPQTSNDTERHPNACGRADDPAESRRFTDMAREVGADESSDAMERAFKSVTRTPLTKTLTPKSKIS